MKTKCSSKLLGIVTLLFTGNMVLAQSTGGVFAVTSSVMAAGGGTSTGGVFRVTGTLGQPVTGAASGGNFAAQSGFWGIVQTPGAPALRITRASADSVVISWPAPSSSWVLQQSAALGATALWTDVISPPVVVVGSDNTVTFTPATGTRYFRLRPQ